MHWLLPIRALLVGVCVDNRDQIGALAKDVQIENVVKRIEGTKTYLHLQWVPPCHLLQGDLTKVLHRKCVLICLFLY